jgi:hypothetical protein
MPFGLNWIYILGDKYLISMLVSLLEIKLNIDDRSTSALLDFDIVIWQFDL